VSIVFFGTPDFAVPSLTVLIDSGEEISLVVTQTDKVKGRGHRLSTPPVKEAALKAGLRVLQPSQLKDTEISEEILSLQPDFIVVIAYGKLLPKSLLEIPRYGCVNVHASLLPKYRGAAPVAWAIMKGEEKTGITTMLMNEGLDTGPILLQEELDIDAEDTTGSLSRKLSEIGASLLRETIEGLRNGSLSPRPQSGEAGYAPTLRKEDGLIDWSKSAAEISDFIRGMNPWPGAYCHIGDETLKILKARPMHGTGLPGVIEKLGKNELIIGTGSGLLSVIELLPSGKKPMPTSAFLQGRRLAQGIALR